MGIIAWITGIMLLAGFGGSGMMKVIDHPMMVEARTHLGIAKQQFQGLGALELAGGIGVIIGLVSDGESFEWIGPLAGLGLLIVGIGAVLAHRKAGDETKEAVPAAVLSVAAIVYIITVIAR